MRVSGFIVRSNLPTKKPADLFFYTFLFRERERWNEIKERFLLLAIILQAWAALSEIIKSADMRYNTRVEIKHFQSFFSLSLHPPRLFQQKKSSLYIHWSLNNLIERPPNNWILGDDFCDLFFLDSLVVATRTALEVSVTSPLFFAYRTVAVVGWSPQKKIVIQFELNRTIVLVHTRHAKIHSRKLLQIDQREREQHEEHGKWALMSEWLMEILVCQIMKLKKVEKNFNYAPRGPCVWIFAAATRESARLSSLSVKSFNVN